MQADAFSQLDMATDAAKTRSYAELAQQARSLFADERDWLANTAQFAALIFQQVPGLNWAGFYLNKQEELVLGAFQGKVACVRIAFDRGVCGACARERKLQLVADVHAFPGHIACDSASNAEIVLPVIIGDTLWGVFDVDSPLLNRFDAVDAQGMQQVLNVLIEHTDFK